MLRNRAACTRRDTRARGARARTVFQADPPPMKVVTIEDIDSLMVLTNRMSEKNRRDVFYSQGIDYDKVREYYDDVVFMDRMYINSPGLPRQELAQREFAKYYEYMRRIVVVFLLLVSGRF